MPANLNVISSLLLAYVFSGICHVGCLAQDNSFKFRRITTEDGLSQSSVPSIVQDKQGYIWFATSNGLNRYDGYEFKTYRHELYNENSLSNDRIEKLFIDSKDRFWIGTEGGGLNLFNTQTGLFKQIHPPPGQSMSINAIHEDSRGLLWIGTRNMGLHKLEENSDESFSISSFPVKLEGESFEIDIMDITTYRDKLLLGTSGKGLLYFDPEHQKFLEFHPTSHNEVLGNCFVNSFYTDKQNNLWVATDDAGLFIFQTDAEAPVHINFKKSGQKGFLCDNINVIAEDKDGFLWVGTKGGLNVSKQKLIDYDNLESLTFSQHVYSASNQKSLSNNLVISLFQDISGLMWVGTSANGVNIFHRGSELFSFFQKIEGLSNGLDNDIIMSVYDDEKGALWLGSDVGLIKFDKGKKVFKSFRNAINKENIGLNTIMSITDLDDSKFLLGTYGSGLILFDPESEQFTILENEAYRALNLNQKILTTYKDRDGNIWVGTDGNGVVCFRYGHDIRQIAFRHFRNHPADSGSLSHNDVWKFFEDPQENLWIGTAGGLNRYLPAQETFICYKHEYKNHESISSNRVYCLSNLDSDRLLIGTDNGLNILDKATGKFKYFSEKDGLPDRVIYGILAEDENFFWLSTNKGISRFDLKSQTFKNYSSVDGLPSNEFNTGAYHKNARGDLFFGSTRGLLWFNPSTLLSDSNRFTPPIVISEIEVKGGDTVIEINKAGTVTLPHHQNTLTLSFAALDFTSPSKNQYAYKLGQQDEDWTHIGNRRFVTFSDLNPGSYTFTVKGTNSDGIWNETPATLQFTILSPWWQTWWAYMLLGFILFWMFVFLRRYEIKRIKLRQLAMHLSELDAFKSRFYTNLTHEFRSPLTIILGLAQSLRNNSDKNADDSLKMIQRNGENLLHLINQMLDVAKLESGKMELQSVQADIIPFIKYVCESFQSLARDAQINLIVYCEIDSLMIDFDPDRFSVIISNLLSNAIKFTQPKGRIIVHVTRTIEKNNERLSMKVIDNGPGVSEELLPKLFDRFFQEKSSVYRTGTGTGIGLSLTKELVTLMNGTIEVQSKPGKGSEFHVLIPVTRNAPAKHDEDALELLQISVLKNEPGKLDESGINEESDNLPLALIVEDNADVTYYLKNCLLGKYHVLHAENGTKGIELALETIPDIIICDVVMPGKDGFEVCFTLKSDDRTDHIPIILLTAKATIEDRIKGLAHGADAYLTKPFVKEELFTRLDQLVILRKKLIHKFEHSGLSHIIKHRPKDPETQFIQKAVKAINESLENEAYGSADLAQKLNMSESQLYRKLKALSGKSTAVFIRSVRLKKAKEMLLSTDMNISEIAYETGFSDPAWFSRAFKAEFGSNPSETRTDHSV